MSAKRLCDDSGVFRAATHFFSGIDEVFHPSGIANPAVQIDFSSPDPIPTLRV